MIYQFTTKKFSQGKTSMERKTCLQCTHSVSMCYVSVVHFSAGQPYCCVKFVSLRAGEEVHNVSFSYPVSDIKANDR